MLTLSHINKTFPDNLSAGKALDDLSLQVNDGDFITIIGGNGAGKSTLFNAIAGSIETDSGSIVLDGADITFTPEHTRARSIGRLFQDPMRGTAPNMTVLENLTLAAGKGGWLSSLRKADKIAFTNLVAELDMGLEKRMDQPVGSLSGGQRQALTLLMATVNPPKLLLLDECTAALDPATADKVLALINRIVSEHHITCLMITHDMEMALTMGNRTLMMIEGKIVMDVSGEERAAMQVSDLLDRFREIRGKALANDRILLS